MIKRILLENWRSHQRSELVFSKGTNVLVGRMGSGKSSVMDAICFALFGTFPNVQSRKVKLEDYIMNKPEVKNKARIELDLEVDGKEYRIIREITRGKGTSKAELFEEGKLKEAIISRVNESVTKIIGMNYDLFSKAIYSEQNQIDYFLQIPAGKRKQKIDELLGIDKFEDARKNLVSALNRVKDRIKDRKKEIEGMRIEEIRSNIEKIKSEIENTKKEIASLEVEVKSIETELDKTRREKDELEKKRIAREENLRKIEKMSGELELLNARKSNMVTKLGKYIEIDIAPELEKAEASLQDIENNIKEIDNSINELSNIKLDLATKLEKTRSSKKRKEELEKRLISLKEKIKEKEKWNKELEKADKELEELNDRLTNLIGLINKLEDRERSLSKAEGVCPVCESDLPNEKRVKLLMDAKDGIKKAKGEIKLVREKINEGKRKKMDIERIIRDILVAEKGVENIEKEIREIKIENEEQLANEVKEIEDKINKLREEKKTKMDQVKLLTEKVNELRKIDEMKTELKNTLEKIEKINSEISKLKENLDKIKFDESEYERVKEKYIKLNSDLSSIKAKLAGKFEIVREKERLIKELEDKLEWRRKLEEEIKIFEDISKSLAILATALETSQLKLREEFVDTVNAALADIWPRIYPYEDYQSLRLNVAEKDYVLELQRNDGEWVNVEGIASGGERSSAALALRVAFALVLTQKLSWLILDEPTHNLDKEGVKTLALTLKDHLPGLVEQIFIITHDDEMERAVSGTLYRFERDKSANEPTRVTLISSGSE